MDICLLLATTGPTLGVKFLVPFLLLTISFPVLIAFFAIREHGHRKEREDELEKERSAAKIAQLTTALVASQAEAERIGRNLHDSVVHHLSVIRGQLALLAEYPDAFEPSMAKEMEDQVRKVLTDVRNQSHSYTGHTLENFGLLEAIKKETEDMRQSFGKDIVLTIGDFHDHYLSRSQAEHLYYMFMEGAHNALKHSGAAQITVCLDTNGNEIQLAITDNGCGFTFGEPSGVGLKNILYRSIVSEGSYHVHTKPGQGTILHIKLPKYAKTRHTGRTTGRSGANLPGAE